MRFAEKMYDWGGALEPGSHVSDSDSDEPVVEEVGLSGSAVAWLWCAAAARLVATARRQ